MIKWSQWASTRPDMFPEELCNILSDLQANAPTHSFAFTERQITAELGKPINAIFDYFDKTPVASGSVRAETVKNFISFNSKKNSADCSGLQGSDGW